MDAQLQKHYENMFSMFASDGWKDFMEDVGAMVEARDRLDGVNTVEELKFAKGELSILNWLKGRENAYNNAFEQLKEEDKNVSGI